MSPIFTSVKYVLLRNARRPCGSSTTTKHSTTATSIAVVRTCSLPPPAVDSRLRSVYGDVDLVLSVDLRLLATLSVSAWRRFVTDRRQFFADKVGERFLRKERSPGSARRILPGSWKPSAHALSSLSNVLCPYVDEGSFEDVILLRSLSKLLCTSIQLLFMEEYPTIVPRR